MSDWCILRTAGRSTLRLAETLAEDGFDVWAPAETRTITIARASVKREVTLPMMPGYVFARASRVHDLLRLLRDMDDGRQRGVGRRNHPRFSVWLLGAGMWSIADRDLNALRQQERDAKLRTADRARRALAKSKAEPLPVGIRVRVKDGNHDAFEGMIGRVVQSGAGTSRITFTGYKMDVTIRTSLLSVDDIEGGLSLNEIAAQDAA
jgi:RNase P/RNase MRP subunit p29